MTNPHDAPEQPDPAVWARPDNPDTPTQAGQIPPPTGAPPPTAPVASSKSEATKLRRLRLRDPLSIVLIVVIVVSFTAAGLLGAELYARHVADTRVAAATECVVQDKASVSFGLSPFLLQRLTSHYGPIVITTAGNQIRRAKGMKAQVKIDDVRLDGASDSKGTIGALEATITWPADGIRQTVQNAIPLFGSFLTGVKTNPSNGTIELQGELGSITAKPQVVNNAITMHVVQLTGLGFTLPSESVQPALDVFTNELANNFPLGIHPDSVQVTETGVTGRFSTRDATIPQGNQDPCFANL